MSCVDRVEALKKGVATIEKEIEYAIRVNPQMALGMFRSIELLNKEIENMSSDK